MGTIQTHQPKARPCPTPYFNSIETLYPPPLIVHLKTGESSTLTNGQTSDSAIFPLAHGIQKPILNLANSFLHPSFQH